MTKRTKSQRDNGSLREVVAVLNHTETDLVFTPAKGYMNVGVYPIVVSALPTKNYEAVSETISLEITEAHLSGLALVNQSFTYDGQVRALAVSGDLQGATVTYTNNDKTDAGTYTVSAIVSKPNYEDEVLTGILTINKAVAVITADEVQTHVYDGSTHSIVARLNHGEGSLRFDPLEAYTTVGNYSVVVSAPATKNYEAVSETVVLIIEKASILDVIGVIAFNDGRFIYDGTKKSLAISGDLPNGTSVRYEGNGKIEAGVYAVKAIIDGGVNYENLTLSAELVIDESVFSGLTFKDETVTYDGKSQSLEVGNLPSGAKVVYTGNAQMDAGIYTVSAKVSHPDYDELTLTASLIITKANQKIVFDEIGTVSKGVNQIPLKVSSNRGLPVSVVSDDVLVATVAGSDLLIHRLGTVRLTATQEGDKNHEAAAPVSITVQVSEESEGPIKVHPALSPNGDGINDILIIVGIKDYPLNNVQVVTRNGLMVFRIDGYDNDSKVFRGFGNTNIASGKLPEGTYFYVVKYNVGGEWEVKKGWFVLKN